tara:strand:+ start:1361 stop:2914 length:1554 start_codon:yes stop_codon:yes gene_type:complete
MVNLSDLRKQSFDLLPSADSSVSLGSSSLKFKDLYLSENSLHLGDKPFSKKDILDFDLGVEPETMTMAVDVDGAGGHPPWLWSWDVTSNIPYARQKIRNSAQGAGVPLYKQGTYTIKNFVAHSITGATTQTHKIYLKWINGAGTQNIPSWSTFTLIDSDETFDQVRGGVATDVQRLNISVPAALSIPTADSGLTAPAVTYNIGAAGGLYKFTGMAGSGDNRSIGPVYVGGTYTFAMDSTTNGHPIYLSTESDGGWSAGNYEGEYLHGVTNSRAQGSSGTTANLLWTVPDSALGKTFKYRCGNHSTMRGAITVKPLQVDSTGGGVPVLYLQHDQEMHADSAEIRDIPAAAAQMCMTFDGTKFIPQDMNVYLNKTPIMREAVKAQAKEQITTEISTGAVATPTSVKAATTFNANLAQQGDLSIVAGTAKWYAPFNAKVFEVVPRLGTAADGVVTVQVQQNDSNQFAFQIPAAATNKTFSGDSDVFSMASGNYLTVDVTSIGTSAKGKDLVVQFKYRESG